MPVRPAGAGAGGGVPVLLLSLRCAPRRPPRPRVQRTPKILLCCSSPVSSVRTRKRNAEDSRTGTGRGPRWRTRLPPSPLFFIKPNRRAPRVGRSPYGAVGVGRSAVFSRARSGYIYRLTSLTYGQRLGSHFRSPRVDPKPTRHASPDPHTAQRQTQTPRSTPCGRHRTIVQVL